MIELFLLSRYSLSGVRTDDIHRRKEISTTTLSIRDGVVCTTYAIIASKQTNKLKTSYPAHAVILAICSESSFPFLSFPKPGCNVRYYDCHVPRNIYPARRPSLLWRVCQKTRHGFRYLPCYYHVSTTQMYLGSSILIPLLPPVDLRSKSKVAGPPTPPLT